MSTSSNKITAANGGSMRRSGRLQYRAPASLKINPASSWKIAIPLLSPLASSPPSIDRRQEPPREEHQPRQIQRTEPEKLVFKMWQHPAAPLCCESFVPV
ncbi:Helicase protein with RING/U-box domain [Hibiscus syriacus]|uniref:Helicase protein with RING/U-box domain n=1 Tax=Hibiscus syriacus TaxID=106335 RepID=A0A6A3CVA7_HIBSY|nr:uncharacterized protein At4g14450, chloroplastic-like [Hibiscus syriacus]KAE8731198.1 Helicase protein with RING/U-box domain [Hibiscus syriacus]